MKLEGIKADIPDMGDALSYISGIRLDGEGAVDLENRRIHMSSGLSYAIISLPGVSLDITGNEVALSSDGVFEGSLTVDTKGMGTAYNASELSDIFGLKLGSEQTKNLDRGLFPDAAGNADDNGKVLGAFLKLYDSVQVDEAKEKRDIYIDGKSVACDVYPIKVDARDINTFLDEIGAEGIKAAGDCTMEAVLTPKGNLAYFEFEYEDCVFDLEIRSEKCARNDMNMMLAIPRGVSYEIACNGSESGDVRQDAFMLNVYNGMHTISCEISAESTMAQDMLSIDMSEIKLTADGQEIDLSGGLDLIFEEEEIADAPGPKREILKMSEADFDSLGVEIYDNLMKNDLIAMILSQFGGAQPINDLLDLMNSGRQ